jgi:hypothetical protein
MEHLYTVAKRRRILLDDCVTVGMVLRRSSNGRLAAKLANTHNAVLET